MCFGGSQPKVEAPKIEYVGPTDEQIQQQQESLAALQQQIAEQQATFTAGIQSQIDDATNETTRLQSEFEAEQEGWKSEAAAAEAAAAGAGSAAANNAYAVTATQSTAPVANTTEEITKKKKPKSSLKIQSNAVENTAGTGLNIGV